MANFDNVNRVFILGAGFSKAAGMPLSNELTTKLVDTVFTRDHIRDDGGFQWWFQDISARIKKFSGKENTKSSNLNIEQFFECANFDADYCRIRQQECTVGRNDGETPYGRFEEIINWLHFLENQLVGVLIQYQKHADIKAIKNFSENLEHDDVILTFNYDTILETSLSEINQNWHHGFDIEDATDASIPILKLHGSIDWWKKSREYPLDNAITLFEKTDVNRERSVEGKDIGVGYDDTDEPEYDEILYRVSDLDGTKRCFERFTGLATERSFAWPGLAGLGSNKSLHNLVGSGVIWKNANHTLKSAKEIYIVGWSASPFDTMARFYFCSMLYQRKIPPSRIVVVDPNVGDGENYKAVFGEVIPVDKRVEEVDWDELLTPLTI